MNNLNNIVDLTFVPKKEWREKYIGDGYRSCYYHTVRNEGITTGEIILFGYDKENKPSIFRCPHEVHVAYTVQFKTDVKDIFGKNVKYRYFTTAYDRKKFVDNFPNQEHIVECLRPEAEFLHEMFDDVALSPSFNSTKLHIAFIDIETEISEQFEKPKDARNRINMITVYDCDENKYHTWSLQDAKIDFKEEPLCHMDKNLFDLRNFDDNEQLMLMDFLEWWEKSGIDCISGYNSMSFDIPYIVNRIERVLGNPNFVNSGSKELSPVTKRLSPVGKVRIRQNNLANERAEKTAEIIADITGIFSADFMILYRDKFKWTGGILDGGFSLNNVGEHEGLGQKIHYEGSLKDLYIKDWQKFYEYNVRDVDLLRRLEEKCELIPLARLITSFGLSDQNTIYSSIPYLMGSLMQFSKTQFGTVCKSFKNGNATQIPIAGAYVIPTAVGRYDDGIACGDVASLYPSSMRMINLSPETYVGKISRQPITDPCCSSFTMEEPIDLEGMDIIEPERYKDDKNIKEFYFLPANGGKQEKITREQLDKLLEKKCVFTRNNTLFLKHSVKQGLVSGWCKHFYSLRKTTKKEMQKLELALYNNEIESEKIEETKNYIHVLDSRQMAFKLMINSLYGILGSPAAGALYNPYMAQSITRTGRFFNCSATEFVTREFNKRFGNKNEIVCDRDGRITRSYSISGDTDSNFFHIKCVTEHFREKYNLTKNLFDWSDEFKLKLWNYVRVLIEEDMNTFLQDLVKRWYHSEHTEVMKYELEYIADNGVYESKKHYGIRKILLEGPEIVDKIKYSGIELKKGNIPPEVKDILNDIYSGVLTKYWTENDFKDYMRSAYDRFCELNIQQISFWKGYGTAREATGFLQMQKGSTSIASACTFYNQLLKNLNIGSKYNEIIVGEKGIRFCYIKSENKFGIKYIAFKDGQYPTEFEKIFTVDYETMWDKMVMSPLKNFIIATKFHNFDVLNQNILDPDDF